MLSKEILEKYKIDWYGARGPGEPGSVLAWAFNVQGQHTWQNGLKVFKKLREIDMGPGKAKTKAARILAALRVFQAEARDRI